MELLRLLQSEAAGGNWTGSHLLLLLVQLHLDDVCALVEHLEMRFPERVSVVKLLRVDVRVHH